MAEGRRTQRQEFKLITLSPFIISVHPPRSLNLNNPMRPHSPMLSITVGVDVSKERVDFILFCFGDKVSLSSPGWFWNLGSSVSYFLSAKITGQYHHTWLQHALMGDIFKPQPMSWISSLQRMSTASCWVSRMRPSPCSEGFVHLESTDERSWMSFHAQTPDIWLSDSQQWFLCHQLRHTRWERFEHLVCILKDFSRWFEYGWSSLGMTERILSIHLEFLEL